MDEQAPACAAQSGTVCRWIWDTTGSDFLAVHGARIIDVLLGVLIVLAVAFTARALLHRAIRRVTGRAASGAGALVLRSLRTSERARVTAASMERRRQRALAVGSLLSSIASVVILGIATVLVLEQVGVDIAPLLTSAGIAGVALAFGAQNLVRDFLAGVFMTLEDQYGVGDTVDLGPASGTVVAVSLRTTTVQGPNGTVWHVRNGEVTRVGNASQAEAVVTIDVPLPVTADLSLASSVITSVASEVAAREEFAQAVSKPPELLGVTGFAPGEFTMQLTATMLAGTDDAFARAVRGALKARFDELAAGDDGVDFRLYAPAPAPGTVEE